jgi:phosphohistidine phosphatase
LLADHDRPLAPRGIRALTLLSNHIANLTPPEIVVCSTARRTVETLEGIRAVLSRHALIEMDRALYGATAETVLGRLHRIDSDVGCAMVIGHNPAMQDLAMVLAGAGDPDMRAQLASKLPTAATVSLSFDGRWADLGAGMAQLDDLFMPRAPRS